MTFAEQNISSSKKLGWVIPKCLTSLFVLVVKTFVSFSLKTTFRMIKQKYMGNIDWGCVLSITKVMFIHVSASDTLCGNES